MSHSGEYVIIGISKKAIGIDIEKKEYSRKILKISFRFFNKREHMALENEKNKKKQYDLFYFLWTQKEAITKGKGNSILLNSKTTEVALTRPPKYKSKKYSTHWTLEELAIDNNYSGIIAANQDIQSIKYIDF
jgi:phosphopantetheinyl transferase